MTNTLSTYQTFRKFSKKSSQRLKTMNCRIVGAICQHNLAQAQRVLVSFQRKKAHYFEKNEKIVTLTNNFIHPCPCFHLNPMK